jgi:hypothetical protein
MEIPHKLNANMFDAGVLKRKQMLMAGQLYQHNYRPSRKERILLDGL